MTRRLDSLHAAFKYEGKLVSARRSLREALALVEDINQPGDDEDVLDLLWELRGLIVLAEEGYRSGVALDPWAIDLWLHEHGYKHPEARQTGM